jgi:hypothetical protein
MYICTYIILPPILQIRYTDVKQLVKSLVSTTQKCEIWNVPNSNFFSATYHYSRKFHIMKFCFMYIIKNIVQSYLQTMCRKYIQKCIYCLDMDPSSKISRYVHANIKKKKIWNPKPSGPKHCRQGMLHLQLITLCLKPTLACFVASTF